MTSTTISVDEGGLRHQADGEKRYLPFASIADVELRTRLFRDPAIVVTLTGGKDQELVLFVGGAALEIHRGLVGHLEARRVHNAVTAPVGWRRDGRALVEWLSAVDATTVGGYRDGTAPNTIAFDIAEDAEADVEERASAIHLLVRSGDGDDLVRVAKLLATRPMPPIVQIAARLAPGGQAFIADDVITEAAFFVSHVDAADLKRHALDQGGAAGERYVTAVAQAKREIAEDARRAASSLPPARAARSSSSMSDRDTSRWIGRSWGL